MKAMTLVCAGSLSLLSAVAAEVPGPAPSVPANPVPDAFAYGLGTQTFGASYQFSQEPLLVETAQAILDMGSNTIKFGMGANYAKDKGGNVRESRPDIRNLRDLAAQEPAHRRVLEMPFAHYLIWVYPFAEGWWKNGYAKDVAERQSKEIYDLACYLLRTYSGSGKTFYLGHWEGDWHLRDGYDTKTDEGITPERVQGMADWLNARQQAVDDAKRDTPHAAVGIWNYTEVNLVRLAMEGRRSVTNDVLPKSRVDFVSYSSYDTQGEAKTLSAALSYIEAKLPPKPGIVGKRVFIGEYGFPAANHPPPEQDLRSRQVLRTALAWGCPFALYWEMYNNEVDKEGRQRGFWLIDDKGAKQPLYHTHRRFYDWARGYRAETVKAAGREPSFDEFRQAAVGWLDGLPAAAAQP
jgi:hypothetical protein